MKAIRIMQRLLVGLFVLVLLAFVGLKVYRAIAVDVTPPVFSCDSDTIAISVTADESALLQGVTARDNRDGDLTDQIMIKGVSFLQEDGSAEVTYIVFDSSNNTATMRRTVRYTDYELPRFALAQPLVYTVGQTVTLLDRLTVEDVLDGDVSGNIRITSQNIINSQPGVYNVTAQVDSRLGETVVLPLKVVVSAGEQRMIQLSEYLIYLDRGSSFDPADYILSITAPDGSAVSHDRVEIESLPDMNTAGVYNVGYSITVQGQSYIVYLTVVVA